MEQNPMLKMFEAVKEKKPDLAELMELFHDAYIQTTAKPFDDHFLSVAPGDYSSPLLSKEEFYRSASRVYGLDSLRGIDLNEREQLKLYALLVKFYPDFHLQIIKQKNYVTILIMTCLAMRIVFGFMQ